MTLKRKIIITSLIAIIIASICLAFAFFRPVNAQYYLSDVSYKEKYTIGDTLVIQSAKITYDGKEYDTDAILHLPDGAKKQVEEITFEKSGKYNIEYRTIVDGKVLFRTVSFNVLSNAFSIDGKGSISYGTNSYFTDNVKGVNVSMSRGSTLTYNRIINLSDNSKNSSPILRIYATPKEQGVAEIEKLKVTLTDIYDSNNYVEFWYKHVDGHIYITGNATGQPASGLEGLTKETKDSILYDGYLCRLWQKHMSYGYSAKTSFTGERKTANFTLPTFEDNFCELSVDYSTKKFYAQSPWSSVSKLVIDLDEPIFFGDNLWEGFKTGEAIMSITSVGSGASFNCFITEIDGKDLSLTQYEEQSYPEISIDTLNYSPQNLPSAIVGKNYPVFSSKTNVMGDSSVVSEDVYVYYNYDNTSRSPVDIIDGYFKPNRPGNYTIVYKSIDSNGNQAIKALSVQAIVRELAYQFIGGQSNDFTVGKAVKVKDVVFSNASEGYTLTIEAIHKDTNTSYKVANGEFVPLLVGAYNVKYTYQDIAETKELSYEITVASSDKPMFESQPNFPRYLIKNCTYKLDKINAYDFSNGSNLVETSVFVSEDGGGENSISDNNYTVNANSSVVITYRITLNGETAELDSGPIPVVDVGYGLTGKDAALDLSKYMQSNDFTCSSKTKNNIVYTTSESTENATLSAINSVYYELFNIEFSADSTANAYDEILVVLTDVLDANKKVTISYTPYLNSTMITVTSNGKTLPKKGIAESDFDGQNKFSIQVDGDVLVFGNSTYTIPLAEIFSGFSDKVNLDISLMNVTAQSNIIISEINGQAMTDSRFDNTAPKLIYTDFSGDCSLGDTVTISPFKVYDFVDPAAKFSYTVKDKNGNFVMAEGGVVLNGNQDCSKAYNLKLSDYVEYMVYGEAVDFTPKNKTKLSRSIFITDKVAPTIELKIEDNRHELGEVVLASYEALDDVSEVTVNIVVYAPDGKVHYCSDGKFTATMLGEHWAKYMVTDLAGNVTFAEYAFLIEE